MCQNVASLNLRTEFENSLKEIKMILTIFPLLNIQGGEHKSVKNINVGEYEN